MAQLVPNHSVVVSYRENEKQKTQSDRGGITRTRGLGPLEKESPIAPPHIIVLIHIRYTFSISICIYKKQHTPARRYTPARMYEGYGVDKHARYWFISLLCWYIFQGMIQQSTGIKQLANMSIDPKIDRTHRSGRDECRCVDQLKRRRDLLTTPFQPFQAYNTKHMTIGCGLYFQISQSIGCKEAPSPPPPVPVPRLT